MKKITKQLIIVSTATLIAFIFNMSSKAQFSINQIGDYSIEINTEYILPQLLKAVMDEDGNLFYCDLTKVLKFNRNGIFIKELTTNGRGPGEFQTLIDCDVTNNYLIVFPFNEFRVLFYNKTDLKYSHEFSLESFRSRKFTTIRDSLFITFNDVSFGESSKALSFYDINIKHFLGAYVNTPNMAYVGNTSTGGGVIANNKEVFYSYISYQGIWKYDLKTGKTKYFDSAPDYFEESDFNELLALKIPQDHRYYRGYMFEKSRSEGIYFLGRDKIIQMIATGNPWESGSFDQSMIKYFLEIWDRDGNKLASKIPTPNNQRVEFVYNSKIYFNTGVSFSEKSENLVNGEELKLFEIYEVITD